MVIALTHHIVIERMAIIRFVSSMHGTDTVLRLLDELNRKLVGSSKSLTRQVLSARPGRL